MASEPVVTAGAVGCARAAAAGSVAATLIGSRSRNVAPWPGPSLAACDGAAVQVDDVPHDGEPEAEPGVQPGRAAVGLTEAIEHERQHLRPDALAGVRDHDLDLRADAPDVRLRRCRRAA